MSKIIKKNIYITTGKEPLTEEVQQIISDTELLNKAGEFNLESHINLLHYFTQNTEQSYFFNSCESSILFFIECIHEYHSIGIFVASTSSL